MVESEKIFNAGKNNNKNNAGGINDLQYKEIGKKLTAR
jgi:hypothetical protein